MSEARDDLFAVAALLAELDRVLHPLERGEAGDFKVDPPLPPSLPTPGAQRRGSEPGRVVKSAPPTQGPRSMGLTEPGDVTAPVPRPPVQSPSLTRTEPLAPVRRRVPRPEGASAKAQESRPMVEAPARIQEKQPRLANAVPVVANAPAPHTEGVESHPAQALIQEAREAPAPDVTRDVLAKQDAPPVHSDVEPAVEAHALRRNRVPRPPEERNTERPRISARPPEPSARRHRVARAVAQPQQEASPAAPGLPPARISPRRRPPPAPDRLPAPGTRKAPPFQDEHGPRRHDSAAQPERTTARESAPERSVPLQPARAPSRSEGRPTPGPVHIEVNALLPPPRVEAPPLQEALEEDLAWVEAPADEMDTGARAFFVNGRRVTDRDHDTLHQAEQRLRRRMTGRSQWRRRG